MEPNIEIEMLQERLDDQAVQIAALQEHLARETTLADHLHQLLRRCESDPGMTMVYVHAGVRAFKDARSA